MITRFFGPPRLAVRTSLAMFTVVAIVLTAVLLLIAVQGRGYVRATVADKLAAGQRMLSALEQRQSRELQAQVAVLAESPTLKAAIDIYQAEIGRSDATTRAELTGLVSLWTARSLARPIDTLSKSLSAMTRSRAFESALPTTGSSLEVDALTRSFNSMMATVSAAEAETQSTYVGAIRALALALDVRDPYTAGHSERVSAISVAIGRQMGLSPEDLEILRLGALLHDIGKIGISDHVLRKPESLTAEEYELIKEHPGLGARILRTVPFLTRRLPIVELHHERPDGRGYPYGLSGDEIPVLARIVHVADAFDAFDAMTSARAYRGALDSGYATRELWRCSGTQFDAEVVQALVQTSAAGNPAPVPAPRAGDLAAHAAAPRRLALVPAGS